MIECKIEKLYITPELALQGLQVVEQYIMQNAPKSVDSVELPFRIGNTVIARIGEEITMHTYGDREQADEVLRQLKGEEHD